MRQIFNLPPVADDDVTRLAEQRRELEARNEYLSYVSHELRTPLNTIVNYAEFALLGHGDEARQLQYVRTIHEASMMLLQIVDGFLDMDKLAAGQLTLERQDFELGDVLASSLSLVAPQADRKDILLVPASVDAVPTRLVGDPSRLRQVLINLLSNAIKFTRAGTVRVTAGVESHRGRDVTLRFDVTDTGIGIPADALPHLFAPYYQVSDRLMRTGGDEAGGPGGERPDPGPRPRGSGLGLTISRRLVECMGGRIEASSEPGRGSRFSFTVRVQTPDPTRPFQPVALHVPATRAAPAHREADVDARLRGRYVLVVDDAEINQQLALEDAGLRVDIVDNGYDAIARIEEVVYDAILMDMHMPGLDGCETTRRIRELPEGRTVPVVAVTAGVSPAEVARCLAAGMDAHISKPVRPRELHRRLAQVLDDGEVDFDHPVRELGWTGQMLANQLELFIAQAREAMDFVARPDSARALPAIQRLGHNFRGAARAFRADGLLRAAEALEFCESATEAHPLLDRLGRLLPGIARAAGAKLQALAEAG